MKLSFGISDRCIKLSLLFIAKQNRVILNVLLNTYIGVVVWHTYTWQGSIFMYLFSLAPNVLPLVMRAHVLLEKIYTHIQLYKIWRSNEMEALALFEVGG